MISPPHYVGRYRSAQQRFLTSLLEHFFARECPKLFGPVLRRKIVEELLHIITQALPLKDHLMPGQMLWYALDKDTPAGSKHQRLVPVILTLVNQEDVQKLASGTLPSQLQKMAIARVIQEAYQQGGILSMRDIGLFTWRDPSTLSQLRKAYEADKGISLPHTGALHDRGPCVSHKTMIVRKIIQEHKDPYQVAQETHHSIQAVERYLKDFRRVQCCFQDGKDIQFITTVTGIHKYVVNQYLQILQSIQKNS